jgi:histidinol-phosphate aminotransferase
LIYPAAVVNGLVTPTIELLQPYEAGKPVEELAREVGVTDAVKLASNENPLGPSPLAAEAVTAAMAEVHRYPDAAAYRLRQKLSDIHGVPMEEILHGNGSNELLDLLVRTFTTKSDHVVFAEPAFVVYRLASLAHGTPFTAVPLRDWTHDLPAMAAAVTSRTRLMFIANPNNPTSTHVGREAVERLLREVPEQVIIVLDEAYIEYADADDFPDCLKLRHLRKRLVVLRTFSKVYGLAALRVGYAVGPAQLIDYLNRVRQPFSVGSLGQAAALAALDDHAHVGRSVRTNQAERARLIAALRGMGFEVPQSQANFVFVRLGRSGREVYQQLLRKGVIIRPFGDTDSVRVTVGRPPDNDRCLAAMQEVLK